MRNGIPIDLRFVFAIRGVPHDFGTVAEHIADSCIRNLRTFHGVERGKAERSLRGINHVLERKIIFVVSISTSGIEVVSGAVLKSTQNNFVLHTGLSRIRSSGSRHGAFFGSIVKGHIAASGELDHDNRRVHAYMTNFHAHTRSHCTVELC